MPRSPVFGSPFLRRVTRFFFFLALFRFCLARGARDVAVGSRRTSTPKESGKEGSPRARLKPAAHLLEILQTRQLAAARAPCCERREYAEGRGDPKDRERDGWGTGAYLGPQATHITRRSARGFSYVRCSYCPERGKNGETFLQ